MNSVPRNCCTLIGSSRQEKEKVRNGRIVMDRKRNDYYIGIAAAMAFHSINSIRNGNPSTTVLKNELYCSQLASEPEIVLPRYHCRPVRMVYCWQMNVFALAIESNQNLIELLFFHSFSLSPSFFLFPFIHFALLSLFILIKHKCVLFEFSAPTCTRYSRYLNNKKQFWRRRRRLCFCCRRCRCCFCEPRASDFNVCILNLLIFIVRFKNVTSQSHLNISNTYKWSVEQT